MALPALLSRPIVATAAAVGLALFAGFAGYRFRASHVPGELALAREAVLKAERACLEGSVCAAAADRRAAESEALVRTALADAEARHAADLASLEAAGREAVASARSAGRRELEALQAAAARSRARAAASQECSAWAATPVPCPLSLSSPP